MKILKYLAFAAGGLVLLCVVALAVLAAMVDGAFVKGRAERYMLDEKKRTLKIDGTPQVKLFPVFRLTLGKTTLSEPGSQQLFVSMESMDVALRVMPLLSGEVAMEAFSVAGLHANVIRAKDGRFNFADLAGEKDEKKPKEGPPKFRVAEVKMERARIDFTDQASGQQLTVADLNVKTGSLEDDTPTPLAMNATISGRKPVVALKVAVAGAARFNLAKESFAFSKLDARVTGVADDLKGLDAHLTGDIAADGRKDEYTIDALALAVKGTLDRDALSAALKAPRLRITPSRAEGQEVTGTLTVKGPGRNVDAKFRMSAVEGSAKALSIPALALDIDSNVAGDAVKGSVSSPVKANLSDRSWELPKIAANLTFTSPKIPQKTVTLPISGSLRANLEKQSGQVQVSTKFDESSINAKIDATKLKPLAATFDVAIDKLNMDRYLPPEQKGAKEEPIELGVLRDKTVSGKLAIGALTARQVKLENVKADIKLAAGKLNVAPHSANLYGGMLTGEFSADANGNVFAFKENLQNVALGPLLRDAVKRDRIEGRATLSVDLRTAGSSASALKRAMTGSGRVAIRDGAIKGMNLAESFRNIKVMLGSKSTKADESKQTDFSEITASFTVRNGVVTNNDMKGATPFARLDGRGTIDYPASTLDYRIDVSVVNTSKGQGGADLAKLIGLTIPVRLYGSLDNPSYTLEPDASTLLALGKLGLGVGGIVGGAVGAAAGAVLKPGGSGSGLGDALKGFLGRKK